MLFWNSLAFSIIQWMLAIWSLVLLPFIFFFIYFFNSLQLRAKNCRSLYLACNAALEQVDSSAFYNSSLNIWKFLVHELLKPSLENFERYFASMWNECNCVVVWAFFGIAFLWDWNENLPSPVLWPLLSFPNLLAYWVQHFHSIIF